MDLRDALLLSCLFPLIEIGYAARRVDAHVRARSVMKARWETALVKREEPGILDTTELLQLSKGESMKELRQVTDAHGTTLQRLEEEYQGIPVYDSSVTVRKDEHGHLTGDASGVLFQDIADDLPDTEPNLSDKDTLEMAIEAEKDENMRELISDERFHRFILIDANDKARLVNIVSYSIDGVKKPMYMIDLRSGEILQHWNSFMTLACCQKSSSKTRLFGGNEKIGKVWYGSQPYCQDFTVDSCNRCYLENKYVRVVDMKQSKNASLSETASFPCNGVYGDEVNGAYSPAIDAFFHGTIVGKMFEEWYNSTVLNDKMIIRVHYRQNYSNAFWNSVNSTFGDGADDYYPLITMDIVGHEFGHGVVEQGSDLQYFGESGGGNEAFADIMGEATEEFFLSSDFLTGNKVTKNTPYLREFEVPSRDNVSIGKSDEMTPDMDPHDSSGVYRRVWYIVVKEQEMKARDAFKVFLYANKMYWHYMSNFYDISCGLLRAAMDLGADTKPFAVAFEDVGIAKCNVSSHIYGLTNNKTQRGITVSDTTQPIFAFAMPEWGSAITVEAISPSSGSVFISLHKGSWEDEEFDVAEVVASGNGKLKYNVNISTVDTSANVSNTDASANISNADTTANTSNTDIITHSADTNETDSMSNLNYTASDTKPANETDIVESPTQEPSGIKELQFFVKLSMPESNTESNDVELTVGYICANELPVINNKTHGWYRYICFGEM